MPRDEYDDGRDEYDPGFDAPRPRRRAARRGGGSAVWWVLGGVGCTTLVGCAGLIGLIWYALSPTDFPDTDEDYAAARKAFRTKLRTAGPAPQPGAMPDTPADADRVEYTSGGLTLAAWASKPPADNKPRPAVLFLHSGFAIGADDWEQTQPLRDAGFLVLVPVLRGENGQPGSYTLFCDEVGDCLAAADVLGKRPGVDPKRLYVAGYSSGGTLAMLCAMADARFKGCAAISGSPDQATFVRFRDPAEVPFDPTSREEVRIRSPLAWPKSFKCPARLFVGDDELPYKLAAEALAGKAQAAGKDVVCDPVDGDHETAAGPALRRAVTFFQGLEGE